MSIPGLATTVSIMLLCGTALLAYHASGHHHSPLARRCYGGGAAALWFGAYFAAWLVGGQLPSMVIALSMTCVLLLSWLQMRRWLRPTGRPVPPTFGAAPGPPGRYPWDRE